MKHRYIVFRHMRPGTPEATEINVTTLRLIDLPSYELSALVTHPAFARFDLVPGDYITTEEVK